MSFAFGFLLTGSLEISTPDDASCPAYRQKSRTAGAVRLGKGSGGGESAAGAEVAFAEEAVVVAGDEVGFDLAQGVEHDAHDDQTRKARTSMAPGRRETRLMEAPMSPTLPQAPGFWPIW